MARYYGRLGFGTMVEKPSGSGVWIDEITERYFYGDVVRDISRIHPGENLNPDLSEQTTISILADPSNDQPSAIRYVEWAGTLWTVSSVEVQSPRLLLSLGEVYNGPTPDVTPTP